ncbi:MAG TPA: GDSL-type esterase/lipase family protein [Rhodanobacter sp.]|nr:GDSL-type esterase/lipase family protein [Rhodanobacter sp.]
MPIGLWFKRHAAPRFAVACLLLCGPSVHAHGVTPWSTVWMAAMLPAPVPANVALARPSIDAPRLHDQTLRQLVTLGAGGRRLRIRLSNAFGTQPVRIDAAGIGRARDGTTALEAGSVHELYFEGQRRVVLPPGAVRYSDPVELPVRAGETLGVSLYVTDTVAPATWHPDALRDNFISSPGDYTAASAMPVAATTGAALWLSDVEVQADTPPPVLVALGDSITNGFRSTRGEARSYPQVLGQRLRDLHPACHVAVVGAGIDGNEIAERDGGYGPGDSMERRFGRDVLDQPGVRYVLLLGGINDIGETTMVLRPQGRALDGRAVAANVIAAQQRIIAQAHAAGLRILGATLPPFEGTSNAYSIEGERARQRINDWIRHHASFDGVVDFDAVLRDPEHPARLRPGLDSGDHIHPDDRGYAAMAAAVPPVLLGCPR